MPTKNKKTKKSAKVVPAKKAGGNKLIEITKGKTRKEEEKFFVRFSETQLNAVLLLILADTFLVQGIMKYLDYTKSDTYIGPWFVLIIWSLFFLIVSAVFITLGGVINPLREKRVVNLISFSTFLGGAVLFAFSLVFLLFLII